MQPNASQVFRVTYRGQRFDATEDWHLLIEGNSLSELDVTLPEIGRMTYANSLLTTPDCTSEGRIGMSKHTYRPGDANINGSFNSEDLVKIMNAGRYDNGQLATWQEGDFNSNDLFTSEDLVHAFTHGRYRAPRRAVPVPESSGDALFLLASMSLFTVRRRIVTRH